ncbi:MAG TPA: hypothetical protein VFN41_00125 [Candidatus Limnocylindrales bacterium]|nr:hypothetical protein [Candidatus Limnocylindrales bacterium]
MKSGFRRSDRDSKGERYPLERLVEEVVHREDLALGDGQTIERRQERRVLHCLGRRIASPDVDPVEGDLPDAASLTKDVAAAVGENRVEPRVEPTLVAQPREVDPRRNKCFLRGISCIGLITQDRPSYAEHVGQTGGHQAAESVRIASTGACHQDLACAVRHLADDFSQLNVNHRGP